MANNNALQQKILSYLLASGFGFDDTIREVDLAKRFGVSVTPVREALNNLEEKGFVERTKRKGTCLKSFSLKELNEMYDLRGALEGLAARLVCGTAATGTIKALRNISEEYEREKEGRKHSVLSEIDYRFHSLIVESCGNERLVHLVKDLHLIAKTLKRSNRGEYVRERNLENPYTHLKIAEAIDNGDAARAERTAKKHVEWAKHNIIRWMASEGIESLGMAGEARR